LEALKMDRQEKLRHNIKAARAEIDRAAGEGQIITPVMVAMVYGREAAHAALKAAEQYGSIAVSHLSPNGTPIYKRGDGGMKPVGFALDSVVKGLRAPMEKKAPRLARKALEEV
jgi:hypothetical protein